MFLPGLVLFLFLWTVAARWSAHYIWKTAEPTQKVWASMYDPKDHRWFAGSRWNAKDLAVFCLFLWPLGLAINFFTSKPDRPSLWSRLINWMIPKENK